MFPADALCYYALLPVQWYFGPKSEEHLAALSRVDSTSPGCAPHERFANLVHHADSSFSAGDRPVQLHRCENGRACYNWCPQGAITTGIIPDGNLYRHPEMKRAREEIRRQPTPPTRAFRGA